MMEIVLTAVTTMIASVAGSSALWKFLGDKKVADLKRDIIKLQGEWAVYKTEAEAELSRAKRLNMDLSAANRALADIVMGHSPTRAEDKQ